MLSGALVIFLAITLAAVLVVAIVIFVVFLVAECMWAWKQDGIIK